MAKAAEYGTPIPQLRKWATSKLRAQVSGVELSWVEPLHRVTYPTGLKGVRGRVQVSAAGYQTRVMLVESDRYGKSVR